MNKSILISIKPRFVAKILNGEKTIEIRKTMPKCKLPIDVYIYCTKTKYINYIAHLEGKVVAKFTLRKIKQVSIWDDELETETLKPACLDFLGFDKYTKGQVGYAWHISNLEIFDEPLPLEPYFDLKRPPQSWQFIYEPKEK